MYIEHFDYIKITKELPKDGDDIIVANEKNELILAKYPYNGLAGIKILFLTEDEISPIVEI